MNFAAAWDSFEIGDAVEVSNGKPKPIGCAPNSGAMQHWRSNNFSGELIAKLDAEAEAPRRLRILFGDYPTMRLHYDVPEGGGHEFTAP